MKTLIGYDGSESADVAMSVTAAHAARFGGPMSAIPTDASGVDNRSEQQARQLAERGARLADTAGFDATAAWAADDRDVTSAIVDEASKFDVDLVVVGDRVLAGGRAFLGRVSNHVVQHSPRPVLVTPASPAPKDDANPEPLAGVPMSAENGRGRPRVPEPGTGP
jgi:nucleotide-binding universal stress UspA family protein